MEELIKKVEQWSMERNLHTADPSKQRLKLWEEFGELNAAIARDNREDAIDAIGDMLVVMIIYCQQQGYHETKELFEIKVKFFKLLKLLNIVALKFIAGKFNTTNRIVADFVRKARKLGVVE